MDCLHRSALFIKRSAARPPGRHSRTIFNWIHEFQFIVCFRVSSDQAIELCFLLRFLCQFLIFRSMELNSLRLCANISSVFGPLIEFSKGGVNAEKNWKRVFEFWKKFTEKLLGGLYGGDVEWLWFLSARKILVFHQYLGILFLMFYSNFKRTLKSLLSRQYWNLVSWVNLIISLSC